MLAEWISLLGLDEDQPPWDGEPKEIRGKILIGGDEVRVKVIDLNDFGEAVEVYIEEFAVFDGEVGLVNGFSSGWIDIRELENITVVY